MLGRRADRRGAFAFFDDPAHPARLMPPLVRIRVELIEPTRPRPGSVIEFRTGSARCSGPGRSGLLERVVNERFVDETLAGPMRRFHHSHVFTPGRSGTWIEDRIGYHVGPDGWIGAVIDWFAGQLMRRMFIWCQARQRRLLAMTQSIGRTDETPTGPRAARE